jgi:hypothetical protein
MMSPEYQREWRAKNPSRVALYYARKKARLAGLPPPSVEVIAETKAQFREWNRAYEARNRTQRNHDRREREGRNREHYRELRRRWRERNRQRFEALNRARLLKKYGITVAEYDRLHLGQLGLCAICEGPQRPRKTRTGRTNVPLFCVDHDHENGRVRGLLCTSCNLVLGNVKDRPEILRRAIGYLERLNESVA